MGAGGGIEPRTPGTWGSKPDVRPLGHIRADREEFEKILESTRQDSSSDNLQPTEARAADAGSSDSTMATIARIGSTKRPRGAAAPR